MTHFYQYLGDELYAVLNRKVKDVHEQAEIFGVLTQATKLSVMQREQKDLLGLAKKISEERLPLRSATVRRLIEHHRRMYSYMGFYYFRGKAYQPDYFLKRIKQRLRTDFINQLEKIRALERANSRWLKVARRLELTGREIILVKTLKHMAYCTNRFDEVGNFLCFKAQPFLLEVARRLAVTYTELIEMDAPEVINFLKREEKVSKANRKILRQRRKDGALVMLNQEVSIYTGQALAATGSETKKNAVSVSRKLLKGQVASAGSATGKAVLIYSIADLSKVRSGDIMVAKSTVPSFVPAMERAGGIVTEVGGLLSHAAIVARELKTPCVVGVADAMRVIQNGQRVEVDATRGIVKKV